MMQVRSDSITKVHGTTENSNALGKYDYSARTDRKGRRPNQLTVTFIVEAKKCLYCNTYHSQDKQHCPECGRYLYSCGDVYQPKARKKVQV